MLLLLICIDLHYHVCVCVCTFIYLYIHIYTYKKSKDKCLLRETALKQRGTHTHCGLVLSIYSQWEKNQGSKTGNIQRERETRGFNVRVNANE